ncbi:MAG: hypothetical protein E7345_04450 [Clostridiales bacterium]|nr:hypothetical protein [Clostridiales bacterium]
MLTLTVFSVATRCLGFIFKIYMSQIMTTTDLGIYNLSLSIFTVLLTLVGASIPLTISKITSNNICHNCTEKTKYSVTSSLILTTSISIIISIFIFIFKNTLITIIGDEMGYFTIVCLIPSIIFTALYSQVKGYLWGLENYFSVSLVELIEQILRILFCVIFVFMDIFPSPIISVAIALSVACGISSAIGFFYYFKHDGRFKYKKGYYKEIINSSLPLTGVRLFGSILSPIVALIIPIQLGKLGLSKSLALSELGIIMGMTMPLLSIPSTIIGALCMILIPKLNSENDKSHKNQISNYIKFTLICSFIFIPIFIGLGEPICEYVFGNISAGSYLQSSATIMIPLGLAQITTAILNALNQEKQTFIYYIISSIFLILSVIVLPYIFLAKAMLFASGISSCILAILNIIKIQKITAYKNSIIKDCLYNGAICVPIILLVKSLYSLLKNIFNTFISLAITCSASIIFYILFLIIFNLLDFKEVKKYIVKKNINNELNKT